MITDAQKRQFQDEGYFVLMNVMKPSSLDLLRHECEEFIGRIDAEMNRKNTDVIGINHRDKRYFATNCFRSRTGLRDFLFSDTMAGICRATLGDTAYLFWEQYVVKGKEQGMKLGWHQDAGYVGYPDHGPYVTCWCALDDMSEENGTIRIIPFSRIGIRSWVQHIREAGSNDMIGYFGKERGVPIVIPAGSMAVFSSVSFHSSGMNRTNQLRRAYVAQYSAKPILTSDKSKLWGNAEPFLKDGKRFR